MRKYQQLVIISLGLVSFICFLIYKHEYDRLRNVLQVLEVFGTPPSGAVAAPPLNISPDLLDSSLANIKNQPDLNHPDSGSGPNNLLINDNGNSNKNHNNDSPSLHNVIQNNLRSGLSDNDLNNPNENKQLEFKKQKRKQQDNQISPLES